jgi:diguanylate cyclase (GGDEF)-like protein
LLLLHNGVEQAFRHPGGIMGEKLIGIGAASKLCGLSERTLRYWESLGLIMPSRVPSGHRKYSKALIKKIIALKETLEKNNLRINDLVTSTGFLQDEALKSKVKDVEVFNLKAQMDSFYLDAKKEMRLNPVSGLPDHFFVQQEIERRIDDGAKVAVCYVDMDNFRRYNQAYGYARGDKVLKFISLMLFEKVRDMGNPDDFVGHLGSDNFVVLTTPDRYREICAAIITNFDSQVLQYYDKNDRDAKGIGIKNRKGEEQRFPIMSLTIGVVTNERRKLGQFVQIADIAGELKRYAQTFKRSEFVVDRRSS